MNGTESLLRWMGATIIDEDGEEIPMAKAKSVMCGTCGFEGDFKDKDAADKAHLEFDPAHEAGWYEDGDADKPVW